MICKFWLKRLYLQKGEAKNRTPDLPKRNKIKKLEIHNNDNGKL